MIGWRVVPNASYVQSSFAGGRWSKFAQGRYHDPKYRTALAVCRNGLPLETESWVRRPGTKWAGWTRLGRTARVVRFDFEDETPAYSIEFTDGRIRLRQGALIVTTNDGDNVISISTANPAVAQTIADNSFQTNDVVFFTGFGTAMPLLQNRHFLLTRIDGTHYALADAITGVNIDGSTLGAFGGSPVMQRILEIVTPYVGGSWNFLSVVQTEQTAFMLQSGSAPQALTVEAQPTQVEFAEFTFGAANFEDGPYMDPPTNGAMLTANQLTGVIELTLSFPAYVSTTSYAVGDLVTSSSINYVSLVDQNVGNTPASSPSDWAATNGNVAINNGQGFVQTDIGRLIRLYSEPAPWSSSGSYSAGVIVSYNPSGQPGQTQYWSALSGGTFTNFPGKTATDWQLLLQGGANSPALWTWGKIVSLLNFISGAPSGIAHFGTLTQSGGLAAAFNGTASQTAANSATLAVIGATNISSLSMNGYVGQNYSGCSPSSNKIGNVTIFGSSDLGLAEFAVDIAGSPGASSVSWTFTATLFAKNSPPANGTDGTVLATFSSSGVVSPIPTLLNERFSPVTGPITLISSDQATSYSYVWVNFTFTITGNNPFPIFSSSFVELNVAQMQVVAPPGTGSTGNGCNVELLGPPLLYSTAISIWRLGRFSNTTGWPTTGTWTDGRLWLSGVQPNVIDASVADGITVDSTGTTVNFAPTDQYGNVLADSGISIKLNLPEANPILWMVPDQQGVLCGTKAREVLVFPPTQGGFAPNNIDSRMLTRIGSANIEPIRTEHTIVFVQKFLRKVVEFFADVFSGKFTAPNLIANSKDLTIGGIGAIVYQQELAPIVWMLADGLVGCTYKRDTLMTSSGPTMVAWHTHDLGSGRSAESITAGASVNGNLDALTMVTNGPSSARFVEVLSDILDEGSSLAEAQYLDCAIVPTSTSAVAVSANFPYGGLQLNGLWPHNGQTVTAWLGGLDCGDYVVSNGSIQVPYGDGIAGAQGTFPAGSLNRGDQGLFTASFVSTGITANNVTMFTGAMPMLVGFTFTSQGQLLRPFQPAESGTRNGPAFGKLSRSHYIMAQLEGTQGVSFGYSFGGDPNIPPLRQAILLGSDNKTALTIDQQFTGIHRDTYDCPDTYQGVQVAWQVTRPYICNVTAIGPALASEDV